MFIILSVVILFIALLGMSAGLARKTVYPKVHTYEELIEMEKQIGRMVKDDLDKYPKEEIYISSPYGYKLYGIFLPFDNSKKAVIICHGITCNIYGSVKYIDIFRRRGFNVFIYDHRNHGKSGGFQTAFGYFEKNDLKACTDWVRGKLGPDSIIGTMGESMGAATVLQNLAIDRDLDFCVADCPYSNLSDLLSLRLKIEFHLPKFPFIPLASVFSKFITGMAFNDVSPIDDIKSVNTPVLFIHGDCDTYIPMEMSKKMYEVKSGKKAIYIAKGARHAQSINVDREEYDRRVGEFLSEIGLV